MKPGQAFCSRNFLPALGGMSAFLAMSLLATFVAGLLGFGGDLQSADRDQVGIFLVAQLPAQVVVILFALIWPMGVAFGGELRLRRTLLLYLLFLLVWYPLVIFVYPSLLGIFDVTFEAQPHLLFFGGDLSGWRSACAVVAVCIGGPIAEEVIFRGFLQSSAVRILGRASGLVLTSLAFGLIHGNLYALPMFAMGLFLGYLREMSSGLGAPILIHILHNSHTVLLACVFPSLLDLSLR